MSSLTETRIYASLKNGWSPLRDVHLCRIENASISGMSDVNACYRGREVWIELKVAVNDRIRSPIRSSQIAWSAKRVASGGRVMVLVRDGDDHYYLFRSDVLVFLREHAVSCVARNYGVLYESAVNLVKWPQVRDAAFGVIDDKF